MMNREYIENICRDETFLNENSIKKIYDVSKGLDILADFNECDIFIDVLSRDKNKAIVVFHQKPGKFESIYDKYIVGEEVLRSNEPGVLKTLQTGVPCKDVKGITQENKIVRQKIMPIMNEEEVIAVIIAEKDISKKLEEHFSLDSCSDELSNLFGVNNINGVLANNLDDAIILYDKDGRVAIKNNNAINIYKNLGYFEKLDGMYYDNLSLGSGEFKKVIGELVSKKKLVYEINVSNYFFKITEILVENNEKFKIISVIKDITYLRKKERDLEIKEVILKESNHRIKNNLQLAAGFLRGQSRLCNNDTKSLIDNCVARILAIASTHDFLSKSVREKMSVKSFIMDLINNILSFDEKNVEIKFLGTDFYIQGEKATALFIILNEVIMNSYKHGFEGRKDGIIEINIKIVNNYVSIFIRDNGRGIDKEVLEHRGLGMNIINSYTTEVLEGKVEVVSDESGTITKIKFRIDE